MALLEQVNEPLCVGLFGAQELHRLTVARGGTVFLLLLHLGKHVGVVGVEREARKVAVVEVEEEFPVVLLEDDVGGEDRRGELAFGLGAARLGVEVADE